MKNIICRLFCYLLLTTTPLVFFNSSSYAALYPLHSISPDSSDATLTNPKIIDVYPAIINNGAGAGRLFINTTRVGNVPVTIPLVFDTGSAGLTLNAFEIFPNNIVGENGFKFKPGQNTLEYNGIIITKTQVQKIYGTDGAVETRQIGNIGYAKISVGDARGSLHMLTMPIMFFFKTLANGIETRNGLGSVFGVNTTFNAVKGVNDSSYVVNLFSPLKYLVYEGNLIGGYKIDKITLTGCDIKTPGSCRAQPLLTVGLTENDINNYKINQLKPQVLKNDSGNSLTNYPPFPYYYPSIFNATIGTSYHTQNALVLLDSGHPAVVLKSTKENLRADNFPVITLTLPSKNTYFYNIDKAPFKTRFNPSSSRNVFGIHFFTVYSFLEDYQNGRIGLKAK